MNKLKSNLVYNIAYQFLIMFVPLVTTPYLSRVLGSQGIGEYSYVYTIASYFVVFIKLGLDNYGNRYIARVKDNKEELSYSFWSIYFMQLLFSIISIFTYFFYCFFISSNFFMSLVLSLLVISSMLDITWFVAGMEEFKMNAIRNAVIRILATIAIFAFVKNSSDVNTYTVIMAISFILTQIVVWPLVFKYTHFVLPKRNDIVKHIKPNIILFIPIIAGTLYRTMGKVMLGSMANTIEVGYFDNSEKIIQLPTAFANALAFVMMPRISNLIVHNDTKECENLFRKSMLMILFTSTSMSFGVMAISNILVPWYYGSGFDKCILLFIILAPACIFSGFATAIRSLYLIPHQKDSIYVKSTFLGAFINIVINVFMIPTYGCVGAAFSVLGSEIVVCIYQVYAVRKELNIFKYIKLSIPFLVSGILMFAAVTLISIPITSDFLLLVCKIIIGAIVYMVVLGSFIILHKIIKLNKKRS